MKYINFKRFKFSTILKYINFQRYSFSKIYKYFDFKRYNFLKFYKHFNFKRFNFTKIYNYFDYKTYNFSKIYKLFNLKKLKNTAFYFVGLIIFSFFIYLSIPIFFNYNKSNLENVICKGINLNCSIKGKINYSFFPSPRLKLNDIKISDFINKNKLLVKLKM